MSAKTIPYQSALGIETGDIITTSYATGPYRVVGIHGPNRLAKTPCISLVLCDVDNEKPRPNQLYFINGIHRVGNRWMSGLPGVARDEVFVEKPALRQPAQKSLWEVAV